MNNIYLDYAANAVVDKRVLDVFNDATNKYFANPNSTHKLGIEAKNRIDEARMWINKAIKEAPYLRDPFVEAALLEYRQNKLIKAKEYCLKSTVRNGGAFYIKTSSGKM